MLATGWAPTMSWPPVIDVCSLRSTLNVMWVSVEAAYRMARLPEWAYVPSPMFWKMCLTSVNGAMPIHCAPSAPMCVPMTTLRPIHIAIVWQPMPADTRLPAGARVELLCGQPEQYQAVRTDVASLARAWISSIRATQASADSMRAFCDRRFTSARPTMSASNSPWCGRSSLSSSSYLPTMRGAFACP